MFLPAFVIAVVLLGFCAAMATEVVRLRPSRTLRIEGTVLSVLYGVLGVGALFVAFA